MVKSKLIIPIIIILSIATFKTNSQTTQLVEDEKQIMSNKPEKENTRTLTAMVEHRAFIDKTGRVHEDIVEPYLSKGEVRYFISNCNKIFSIFDFSKHINQIIEAEVIFKNGEWDRCPGDPVMQSRIGEYVEVYSVALIPDNELFIYTDRSNNTWHINRKRVKYTPMKPEMSSSGIYDGGEAADFEIDDIQFVQLRNLTTRMLKDTDLHIEDRVKTSVIISRSVDNDTESAILFYYDTVEHLEMVLEYLIDKK